ncbi:chalcone isomerase family protein [Oxalobacteraceae bacterium A2-2]
MGRRAQPAAPGAPARPRARLAVGPLPGPSRDRTLGWLGSRLQRCLLACLLAAQLASPGHAATWRDELPRAVALGQGDLRWFGLRIYHATLWAEQRPFQPEQPFALQLSYYRSISRDRLVQTSLDEMQRLNGGKLDPATLARWKTSLNSAFTDVAEGDQLTGVYAPGHGMRFYNQQRLLADIADPELARAFFAIWLDQRTRDTGLRRQLLGGQP